MPAEAYLDQDVTPDDARAALALAKEVLEIAVEFDVDIDPVTKGIEEANEAIKGQRFREAHALAEVASAQLRLIVLRFRERVRVERLVAKEMDAVEGVVQQAQELGIPTEAVETARAAVKELVGQDKPPHDIEARLAGVFRARRQLTQAIAEEQRRVKLRFELLELRDKLGKDLTNAARRGIVDSESQQMLQQLAQVPDDLVVEELQNRIDAATERRDFIAMQVSFFEQRGPVVERARGMVADLGQAIQDAEPLGLPVKEARGHREALEYMVEHCDTEEDLESLKVLCDDLDPLHRLVAAIPSAREIAGKKKEKFELIAAKRASIAEIKKEGFVINDVEKMTEEFNSLITAATSLADLNRTRDLELLIDGQLEERRSLLERDRQNKAEADEMLGDLRRMIEKDRGRIMNVAEVEAHLAELTALRNKRAYTDVVEGVRVDRAIVRQSLAAFDDAKKALAEAEELLETVRTAKASVKEVDGLVDSARDAFAEKRFGEVPAMVPHIRTSVNAALAAAKKKMKLRDQAKDALERLETEVDSLQRKGLDSDEANDVMGRVRLLFEEEEFHQVLDEAGTGQKAVSAAREDYRKLQDDVRVIRTDVEKAGVSVDTREIADLVQKAESAIETSRPKEAGPAMVRAKEVLRELLSSSTCAFEFRFDHKGLRPGEWNRCFIEVTNTGKANAKNVVVKVTGPVEVMRLNAIDSIKGGATERREIGFKPKDAGELPLEIEVTARRARDDNEVRSVESQWLMVATAPPAAPPAAAPAPAAPEAPAPRRGAADAAAAQPQLVDRFSINDIFLVYIDGRLMVHFTPETSNLDSELMSSMLVAIQNFVSDSFKSQGGLDSFHFGENSVIVEKGQFTFLAVVIGGKEPPQLRDRIQTTMQRIEGLYSGVIEKWDGDPRPFANVPKELESIKSLMRELKMKEEEREVKILSALEFFQGYVRLKIAAINGLETSITDAALRLIYTKNALRFHHVEPEYPLDGSTVEIGVVKPGEKKTVAFFLDPLICQESFIDCTLTYLDYKNRVHHVDMKRRPVDIVCPIFYTPQTVNTAMLKRLMGELPYKDSRVFRLPRKQTADKAYDLLKESILMRDVRFVREFVDQPPVIETTAAAGGAQQPPPPQERAGVFRAEGWFYGRTRAGDEELVIRASAIEQEGVFEVFVAAKNLASLTGLLAELHHNLDQKYKDAKLGPGQIEVVTDQEFLDRLETEGLLIDKYGHSVTDAGGSGT